MPRLQGSIEGRASNSRAAPARRFVALGRPRRRSTDAGLEAQMQDAWIDLFDAMRAAGYEKRDLVQATVCVTQGGQQQLYRRVRDRMLKGHSAAGAYLHVSVLSVPDDLVEIEGWAEKR